MKSITAPDASRQVAFHQLLVAARKTWLSDALRDTLGSVDPNVLKGQLAAFVPCDAQQILAKAGVRDEHVFPAPAVLEATPTLVGYYRLLLGVPQKSFYQGSTGMGCFKGMETRGILTASQRERLPDFCLAMSLALADLVRQVSPQLTSRDVAELPLLTLGQQFQGANNVRIGKQAIVDIFLVLSEIVKNHTTKREELRLTVRNASGRNVLISMSQDPDVSIEEEFGGQWRKKVAVEIKGGTDKSNAHNRAGEAEKSHQKAKSQGYRDFWTIIAKKGIDVHKLQRESPTTNSWFDVAQVLGRQGPDWDEFRSRFAEVVGIPVE